MKEEYIHTFGEYRLSEEIAIKQFEKDYNTLASSMDTLVAEREAQRAAERKERIRPEEVARSTALLRRLESKVAPKDAPAIHHAIEIAEQYMLAMQPPNR